MNVYTKQHPYYCGIDLHAISMYICILDEAALQLIDHYDPLIQQLDRQILALAKGHDRASLHLLKSIIGVGYVLTLTMLYEIHDISRWIFGLAPVVELLYVFGTAKDAANRY